MSLKKNKFIPLKGHLWFYPVIIGLITRLYKITASSVWHDEGYTMWLLQYDISGIIERTIRDVHPPGYYLIAKPWVAIFGSSEFSIRFLSLLFSLAIIYFVYKIIKEIWGEKAAFLSATLVAVSPFLVRFAQEARMYGVVAFFTTAATFYFVKFVKTKKKDWLFVYVPLMIAAIYTQYYAFFVVISHWMILAVFTKDIFKLKWAKLIKERVGVLDYRWWLANVIILCAYLPWFPIAYSQVTRISGNYWIKPEWITWRTIPNNVLQFATYSHYDKLFDWNNIIGGAAWAISVILAIFGGLYIFKNKKKFKTSIGLYIFGFLPMLLVYILSEIRQPVYQDRYFPFSAVAIFSIWGICITLINKKLARYSVFLLTFLILLLNNITMHQSVDHNMRDLVEVIKAQKQENDLIVSGELYTYLDSSYYFDYQNIYFMSQEVDGYGETSLFYDQQERYLRTKEEVQNNDRIWVIGKTGEKEYFNEYYWEGFSGVTYFEEDKDNGLRVTLYTKN